MSAAEEDATDDEIDSMTADLTAILLSLMLFRGAKVYTNGIMLAVKQKLDVTRAREFSTSLSVEDSVYIRDIIKSFNADTAKAINKAITEARSNNLTTDDIKKVLSEVKANQAARVERFARNESWRVSEMAGLRAMMQLTDELNTGRKADDLIALTYKTWNIQPGACPICIDYSGVSIKTNDKFFGGIDSPPAHVTCRCMLTYSITKP